MRSPRRAEAPMEAIIATGVARANQQEEATIRTAAVASAFPLTRKVIAAIRPTIGRYQVAKRSARRCASARCRSASSTSLMTRPKVVSAPTPVARTRRLPSLAGRNSWRRHGRRGRPRPVSVARIDRPGGPTATPLDETSFSNTGRVGDSKSPYCMATWPRPVLGRASACNVLYPAGAVCASWEVTSLAPFSNAPARRSVILSAACLTGSAAR